MKLRFSLEPIARVFLNFGLVRFLWPWANYLNSLKVGFLTCKWRKLLPTAVLRVK